MSDFLDRPLQLGPHLRFERIDENQVVLIGEREHYMLSGRHFAQLAPLLDGRRTGHELLAQTANQVSPVEVLYALYSMHRSGYLTEALSEVPPMQAALWQSLGLDPVHAVRRLTECTVSLRTTGMDPRPLRQALVDAGLSVADAGQGQVEVVLVEDYLEPGLEALRSGSLEPSKPWLPVKLVGAVPWVGPLFQSGADRPCWNCLAWRLRANRPVEEFLSRRSGRTVLPPVASAPASIQAALGLITFELVRWLAQGGQSRLDTTLLTLELQRFRVEEHTVVRRPQCPSCGDPELLRRRAEQPLVLHSRLKRFEEDGGYRILTPEETLARLERQISPITGVICGLGPVPDRDHPLRPVYSSVALSLPVDDPPAPQDFNWTSAGKGRTAVQARASALCEALERYSAIFQGDEPRLRARYAELGEQAIHPRLLLDFSESQYARREEWNSRCSDSKLIIPLPFDERAELDWTPVWSLTHERLRYVPTAYCYSRYPAPPRERFCQQSSNGNAAGNCLEEAILQGFLELVERDAVAVWWYNRLRRPGVDLQGWGDPYLEALVGHYRSLGWRLWALELTHDLGIPVFVALGAPEEGGRFCIGFGAHLDARLGLLRAFTELNQNFAPRPRSPSPWKAEGVAEGSWLYPDASVPTRTREDLAVYSSEDLREDVRTCVERASRAGLETLVLDQTRPDLGLCAAKVIVPGLRHFWPRFGPGRLYDVPVRMGWRDTPLDESQLNPLHLPV
ncbi:TOMM precursor leader peptide-binding protein [Archangium violaceum]|uniref:TOMM precursor leader peptide-binding protein n=1 Tax=Archangium violaceum TaxID=83451 RepID=UPI002B2DE94E|nr:TOMM precursor leader peptide-binding protein [Archangium violaceum]